MKSTATIARLIAEGADRGGILRLLAVACGLSEVDAVAAYDDAVLALENARRCVTR